VLETGATLAVIEQAEDGATIERLRSWREGADHYGTLRSLFAMRIPRIPGAPAAARSESEQYGSPKRSFACAERSHVAFWKVPQCINGRR
jgi:hypothetical protein